MEQFGISKLDLKRRNRMQILKLLRQQGPTSRIDLSASLELTRAAVTIITNEMIEQGVLYEKGELNTVGQKASRGRKKILIDINKNFRFAFGIAIDNRKIYIGLSNLGGDILEKNQFEARASDTQESVLHQIFINMNEMLSNSCLTAEQIVGAGVCLNRRAVKLMALKETDNGQIDYSPLKVAFQKEFQFPAVFNSIINGLAAAEIDFSKQLPPDENIAMIRFSDHVSATLVLGHGIYGGYHNQAMDLAHMIVNPQGNPCRCGQTGCVVSEFSDESIYVNIVNIFSKEKTPKLYEKMGGNANLLRVAEVHEYVLLEDEGVEELFNRRLQSFNIFLNNLIKIIDPQRIVFFGHQFENEAFMERIKRNVKDTLGQQTADLMKASNVRQENIYLTGCSLAIRQYFVEKGGFAEK